MRRVYLAVSLVLIALCVPSGARAAPVGLPKAAVPLRVTRDPGDDLDPVIAADLDGRVFVAWKRHAADESVAHLCLAQSPGWVASSVASTSPTQTQRARVSLVGGERVQLAWSQPATLTQTVFWRSARVEDPPQTWQRTFHAGAVFRLDDRGRVHAAWVRSGGLAYVGASDDLTATIEIEPTRSIDDLALALDSKVSAHLAWSAWEAPGQPLGVFYASLDSDAPPVQVMDQGRSPRLEVGPSGRAHLCWLADVGLCYATSHDWSKYQVAVPGLKEPDAYAFAVGPGEVAHLVWAEGNSLRYASSVDWECSATHLVGLGEVSGLDMTIDANGGVHVVWAAPSREDNWDVYYLAPVPAPPQVAVTYPRGGELLTGDVSVSAESNSPASELLRVEFYLEAGAATSEPANDVWTSLGLDRDGKDGWSVPLRIEDLAANVRYRVVAMGIDVYGRVAQARGNWFFVQNKKSPLVQVQLPGLDASRGRASLPVASADADAPSRRLDLFLAAVSFDTHNQPRAGPDLGLPGLLYVGPYDLVWRRDAVAPWWQQLEYDSRRLPDGLYRAIVVASDRQGQKGYGFSAAFVRIDNAMFPHLEVISPRQGDVLKEVLRVSARASDPDGFVRRVDFYAERRAPLLRTRYRGGDYELSMPDLVWLGSDVDGSDGWGVRVDVDESLDGDDWHVRAVAFDDQGLGASVRSPGPFSILGRERSRLRVVVPRSDEPLRGRQMIGLAAPQGSGLLVDAQVYLVDADDAPTYLGRMTKADAQWSYEWDTTDFPDGACSLLIVGHQRDGHKSTARSERLWVRNSGPHYEFETPATSQVLTGPTIVRVRSVPGPRSPGEMRFYCRDLAGQLRLIGNGAPGGDGWCVIWDTTTVLDGNYDLVASVVGSADCASPIERRVRVRNATPTIAFRDFHVGWPWQWTREVAWHAEHPSGQPMSVTVEYSSDEGDHWIELATDIPAAESFRWNTRSVPDSRRALLRLTATDGVHHGQVTSGLFAVNNVNEAPQVTLLAPSAGSSHGGGVRIAWQAWDPDGDAVSVNLDYRQADGRWLTLAQQLPQHGQYLSETVQLPVNGDYQLRVVAKDPTGATGTDVVKGIRVVSNTPPTVRLLSPHAGARIGREMVVLWRAADEDDDPLLIDLYYSDNAAQAWLPLAEGLANTGFYVWQVAYLPSGDQYQVRVVARDGLFEAAAESYGVFSIGGDRRPQVVLLSPATGKSVSGIQPIRWCSSSPSGRPLTVDLMLRSLGKLGWEPLALDLPDDGLLLWNTEVYRDGEYELRVLVRDARGLSSSGVEGPILVSNRANRPPQVELLSPHGGEWWTGIREIKWRAWDADGDPITATLRYSPDGGQRWHTLASLDARASCYVWDTRQAQPGGRCLVRIGVSDGEVSTEDTSAGVFRLTNRYTHPPHALFTFPDASGRLVRGNTVSWIAEDADGDSLSVSLSLSEDGGVTWRGLADGLLHTGEYPLDASLLKPGQGQTYRLRLRVSDGIYETETLSPPFELVGPRDEPPELEIHAPRVWAMWSGRREVRWRATDPGDQILRVDLELSPDGGRSWVPLARALRNTGRYTWDTTTVANGAYFLRLTADNGQSRTARVSEPVRVDNPGRNAPVISIVSPRGGDAWSGTRQIRWRAVDADGDPLSVDLAYSLDLGATWRNLARAITNADSYIWDTSNVANADSVWLRARASDGQFAGEDLSDGAFSVFNPRAPMVKLIVPRGGEEWAGKQSIVWLTAHEGSRATMVQLQISIDGGRIWRTLASELPNEGSYLWDTSTVPEKSRVLIRLHATDGLQSGIDILDEPITVRGNASPSDLPFYLP